MTSRLAFLFAATAVALVAVSAATARPPVPLVDARATGGLCRDGVCNSRTVITRDGRVLRDGVLLRQLSEARLQTLRTVLAGLDLTEIRRHPFTGTCPVAYDGQEWVYRFAGHGTPLRSCTWDLAGVPAVELFQRIAAGR